MLEKLDLLGSPCQFYYNGNETYNTKLGGAVGIFISIIMALLFVLFGKDFYYRTNPSVVTEIGNYELYPNFTLDASNYTLIYALEDESGEAYLNESNIYVDLKHIVYSNDPMKNLLLNRTKCKDLKYPDSFTQSSIRFQNHYCLDLNQVMVGGFWDSSYLSYFSMNARQCQLGKITPDGEPCSGNLDPLLLKNDLYLSIYFQRYYFHPSHYSDPLKYSLTNDYTLLDPLVFKVKRFFFASLVVDSNYGWLFDSSTTLSVLSMDRVEVDLNLKREYDSSYSNVVLYFDKKYYLYSRSYQKLQTLAANVGGVMKFFMVIGSFIVKKYSMFYLMSHLIETSKFESEENNCTKPTNLLINNFEVQQPKTADKFNMSNSNIRINSVTNPIIITEKVKKKISFFEYCFRLLARCCRKDAQVASIIEARRVVMSRLDLKNHIIKQTILESILKTLLGDKIFLGLENQHFRFS